MLPSRTFCLLAVCYSAISIAALDCCSAAEPAFLASTSAAPGDKVKFKARHVDYMFRSEGAAAGDFDHDGKMDIAAGSVFYSGPKFEKMSLIRGTAEYHDIYWYSDSFMNFADDLNGDGWTDLIVVGFPAKDTSWFENPKGKSGPWKRHKIISVSNNESPQYLDIDGDGRKELLMATSPSERDFDGPERRMVLLRPDSDPTKPWKIQPISAPAAPATIRFSHGLGAGDINGDGLKDILCTEGWWEWPASSDEMTEWKFHPVKLGPQCAHMQVFDFDGDGDADVASSSAHQTGVWWYEQTPEGFKQHTIDKSYSETHAMVLADINGDSLPDLVTGKRWWSHHPRDRSGWEEPRPLCWYELQRKDGKAVWTKHTINENSGVGTQFEVADVNSDGLLDVVTSNKRGVFYMEQVRD
jgi:hypothetical protein